MRIVVARVEDFAPGERRIVTRGRRSIGVFRVGDRFYALNNHCPHLGGPLCQGRTQAWVRSSAPGRYERDDDHALIACPWHGWEYDLATGQSFLGPGEPPARSYEVSIEPADDDRPDDPAPGGRRPGPFVAETYDVTVERFGSGDHVVVDTTPRPARTAPAQGESP